MIDRRSRAAAAICLIYKNQSTSSSSLVGKKFGGMFLETHETGGDAAGGNGPTGFIVRMNQSFDSARRGCKAWTRL